MPGEIYEQPRAVCDTVRGRVSWIRAIFNSRPDEYSEDDFKQINSVANRRLRGTSWHAGIAGKYMIEQLARVPVDVDYAPSLSQPGFGRKYVARRHLAIRRNRRYDCGDARSFVTRLARP